MNPVLLTTDTVGINTKIEILGKAVGYYQSIYNLLQEMGITPSLQDLQNLTGQSQNATGPAAYSFVDTYVKNALVALATPDANFNGVPINAAALANLITMPDTTALKAAVANWRYVFQAGNFSVNLAYLQIADNVISQTAGANAAITAAGTYYTQTDAGATLATNLQAICNTLNDLNAVSLPYQTGSYATPFTGIRLVGGQFVLDAAYIMRFEANNAG